MAELEHCREQPLGCSEIVYGLYVYICTFERPKVRKVAKGHPWKPVSITASDMSQVFSLLRCKSLENFDNSPKVCGIRRV